MMDDKMGAQLPFARRLVSSLIGRSIYEQDEIVARALADPQIAFRAQLTAMTEQANVNISTLKAQNRKLIENQQEIARLRVLLGRWSTLYVAGPDVIDPGLMTDTVQVLAGTKEGG